MSYLATLFTSYGDQVKGEEEAEFEPSTCFYSRARAARGWVGGGRFPPTRHARKTSHFQCTQCTQCTHDCKNILIPYLPYLSPHLAEVLSADKQTLCELEFDLRRIADSSHEKNTLDGAAKAQAAAAAATAQKTAAPPKTPKAPRTHRLFSPPTPGGLAGAILAEGGGRPGASLKELGILSPKTAKQEDTAPLKRNTGGGRGCVERESRGGLLSLGNIHINLPPPAEGTEASQAWDVTVARESNDAGENTSAVAAAGVAGGKGKRGGVGRSAQQEQQGHEKPVIAVANKSSRSKR